jgi:hypothetical protein
VQGKFRLQNTNVDRIIGSIRSKCLDHIIVDERHLHRVLSKYFQYHHQGRTHLSLNKDCPEKEYLASAIVNSTAQSHIYEQGG